MTEKTSKNSFGWEMPLENIFQTFEEMKLISSCEIGQNFANILNTVALYSASQLFILEVRDEKVYLMKNKLPFKENTVTWIAVCPCYFSH